MPSPPLARLIAQSRIIVCAGSGGVGKTTTAAAVAIAGARAGRRVLALTIDPAARLTLSLGLRDRPAEPTAIALPNSPDSGSLHVMIHDAKHTFDELVKRHSVSPAAAERITGNPLYQRLSTKLAGVSEYMAIEKLFALQGSERFDLIVLDTPPTSNAIDFLTAPARLRAALDSGAGRFLVRALAAPGPGQRGLLRRGMARAIDGLARLTSSVFLQQFASLLGELHELFTGLSQRSAELTARLKGSDVSYLVVSSATPLVLREALLFLEHLVKEGSSPGVLLVNRVHPPVLGDNLEGLFAELARLGVRLQHSALPRVEQIVAQQARAAELDQARIAELEHLTPGRSVVVVPELRHEVQDLTGLVELSYVLLA